VNAAVCARCGEPASKRIRWFVLGRSMPMFDVCAEHVQVEQRVADLLNHGYPSPMHRVRVTSIPEQLMIGRVAEGQFTASKVHPVDARAALAMYRSCRESDMRPWEALAAVRTAVLERNALPDVPSLPLLGLRLQRLLNHLDTAWAPLVASWRAQAAKRETEVDHLLGRDLLGDLERALGAKLGLSLTQAESLSSRYFPLPDLPISG